MPLQVVGEISGMLHGTTDGHSRNAEKSGILGDSILENVANQPSDDRLRREGVYISSVGIAEKNNTFLEHKTEDRTENKTVSIFHECIDDKLVVKTENKTTKARTSLGSLEDI